MTRPLLHILYALGCLSLHNSVLAQVHDPFAVSLRMSPALTAWESAQSPPYPAGRLAANNPLATHLGGVSAACAPLAPAAGIAMGLGEVLERILCRSPSMQQALASTAEQHANLTLAELASRPRISANADVNFTQSPATTLLSATRARNFNVGLALNWVVFDFGASDANIRAARSGLAAALAEQSSAQLAQFEEGLRLYTETLVSQARLQSLQSAEKSARISTEIARARHAAQAGTLVEKLQAESALALVLSDLSRAKGQARTAQGRLAVALGLRATQSFSLIPIELAKADAQASGLIGDLEPRSMSELWISLQDQHPRLAAIRSEIASLEARLDESKAQSHGTVALNSGVAINRGLGGTSGKENNPSSNLSIQYSLPIFEGSAKDARLAQISAQILRRQGQLAALSQDLEAQLWQALQQLQSEGDNLKASEALFTTSQRAQEVALGRYKAGVGSLSDLLNAQNLHSQAVFQLANAGVDELQAKIRLLFSTGKTKPP